MNFNYHMDTSNLSRKKWEYEIERTGIQDLLSFGTADIDYPCPDPVLDAIRHTADLGHLGYPHIRPGYYETIARFLKMHYAWDVDAKQTVLPHVGIYMSCITAMEAFSEPGDEVIIQTPVHARFTQLVDDNGRVVVNNPLKSVDGVYQMDLEGLERLITPRSRILWLCNPHNPVGRAWSREELSALGAICLKHHLVILSDDIYYGMVFPGTVYTPIAAVSPELSDITVECYSASKCFNTTGMNQSFTVITNPKMQAAYKKALHKTDLDYAVNVIGLAVTETAFSGACDTWLSELMAYMKGNYDCLSSFLAKHMSGTKLAKSDSTYFAWIDMNCTGKTSEELVDLFLQKSHVLVNSGAALGDGGEGFIRMNLACPRDVLEEGLSRMEKTWHSL